MKYGKFKGTKEELADVYYSDPCVDRVGEKFGVTGTCISRWLRKYNIPAVRCGGRNFKDLTGQVFGDLTVIKRGENKRTTASWVCKCTCGKIKEIVGSTLRNGMSTSCGCKCGAGHKKDLTGKRFGHLVVMREADRDPLGKIRWRCLCDCGNVCVIPANHLNDNRRKSCGCEQFRIKGANSKRWSGYEEISGTYWHHVKGNAKLLGLTLDVTIQEAWELFIKQERKCALTGIGLQFVSPGKTADIFSQTAWLYRISRKKGYTLDNLHWVYKNYLKDSRMYQEMSLSYWARVKNGAKQRNLVFDVNIEDVWQLFLDQDRKCALTGIEIIFHRKSLLQTASLDRIDSNKGYIEGNLQWVHKEINKLKLNTDNQRFIELCKLVAAANKNKLD